MVKLLSIVWYKILPAMYGGQKGIAGFQQALASHFPLACLCSRDNIVTDELNYHIMPELPTGKSQFASPTAWALIKKAALKESPTHIILEHPYHAIAAWAARKRTGARLIVHSHNIEAMRFRNLGKSTWRILALLEGWIHRRADLSLFKTQQDLDWAISKYKVTRERCLLIPYGVTRPLKNPAAKERIRKLHSLHAGDKLLFFAGTLDYQPNAFAVNDMVEKLIPILDEKGFQYKIIVCGRNQKRQFQHLARLQAPNLLMIGEQHEVTDYFQAADVFINPVTTGGGIQTKNIEALANDCTVVAFGHMSAGIPAQVCQDKLLLATNGNWNNFADMVIKASMNTTHTPEEFFQYFDWQRIIQPLVAYLNKTSAHENKSYS